MTTGTNERLPALDGLRGCLALVVAAQHIFVIGGSQVSLGLASSVAVSLFFVISGLVLTRGYDGHFMSFAARRIVRLWPTFAVCLAGGYAVIGLQPVWSEFLCIPMPPFSFWKADTPVWSLFIEIWSTLLFPFIVWAAGGSILRLCAVVVGTMLLVPFCGIAPLFIVFLTLGAFLAQASFRCAPLEGPAAQWLGRISYSLYLSHWLVLTAAHRLFGWNGMLLAIPLIFPVAWLVWRLVEQPSIEWSRCVGRSIRMKAASSM